MHFDPYESKQSKKRRIISDIGILIVTAMLIVAVFAVFSRGSSVEKYDFESLKLSDVSADTLSSGSAEFTELYNRVRSSESILLDDSFGSKYPTAYALLMMNTDVYNADKPFIGIGKDSIVVAQTLSGDSEGYRHLEVAVFSTKISFSDSENSSAVDIDKITMYTVKYNTRDSKEPLHYVKYKPSTFRLGITKISVTARASQNNRLLSSRYSLRLNKSMSESKVKDELYQQTVYDPVSRSYNQPEIKTHDKFTEISAKCKDTDSNKSVFQISLSDDITELFGGIKMSFSLANPENPSIDFKIN